MQNSETFDVLGIGHALVDIQASSTDSFLAENEITKGAMHLVEDAQAAEIYSKMGPASEISGGCAANTAAGVVACGGSAAFIGTVSQDELGEIFAHDIRSAGVHFATDYVQGGQTGRSFILVTPDGERSMLTNIGVGGQVSAPHYDPALLAKARITYVEGYLFDDGHPFEAWTDMIETIHRNGNQFAISLSDSFCVERHRKLFLDLLDGSVDICIGNEDEILSLFETSDLDEAMTLLASKCEVGAVTRGAKGSSVVCGRSRVDIPAELVNVVDTTGAGDLYASGLLYGIARHWDIDRCGKLGAHAASAIISQMGARLKQPLPPLT